MTSLNLDRFGYYTVGQEKYFNKVAALEAASRKNIQPTWHFNDQIFSKYDWTLEPPFSIKESYRLRAQQLRDRYEYLVLFYSGGIDSHNILTTFLQNDIKLDAVVIYGTFEFDRNKTSKFNLELYNVAIPYAKQYQDRYDLHLADISDYFERYYHPDWIYESGVQLAPYEYTMAGLYKDPYLQRWLEKGHTGIVRGIDKPRVVYQNNQFYLGFLDTSIMQQPSAMLDDKRLASEHVEFFYWSPDAPWLIAKQAHLVKNYFKNVRPDKLDLLTHTNKFSYSTMQRYVTPLIYDVGTLPGQDLIYYNLGKGSHGPVYHHKDAWFHSSPFELKSQHWWLQGIQHADSVISDDYKNNRDITCGLRGFWSEWYDLGT